MAGYPWRTRTLAMLTALAFGLAAPGARAQAPGAGGQAPGTGAPAAGAQTAGAPVDPADQLVGLFGATCLHFAADPGGVRGFMSQNQVPEMPAQARDAFLSGRRGQVFDASVPGVNLALISLDDGGCEAVVEHVDPDAVPRALTGAAAEAKLPLEAQGAQSDGPNGVKHSAYLLTAAGRQMHILVSTAPKPPQAVITMAPK